MKKYILVFAFVLVSFFGIQVAKAEVPDGTYFFADGQGYNDKGEQTFFCLGTTNQTCYTVQGEYAFVRDLTNQITQLNQKIDQLQNTVNQLASSTPQVSSPIVGGEPQVIDTTPPKLLGGDYSFIPSTGGNQDLPLCTDTGCAGVPQELRSRVQGHYLGGISGISVVTDEPTTVSYTFTPATGTPLTYLDSNLDVVHNLNYSSIPLVKGINYSTKFDLTDSSANVTHIGDAPAYNIFAGWYPGNN